MPVFPRQNQIHVLEVGRDGMTFQRTTLGHKGLLNPKPDKKVHGYVKLSSLLIAA